MSFLLGGSKYVYLGVAVLALIAFILLVVLALVYPWVTVIMGVVIAVPATLYFLVKMRGK